MYSKQLALWLNANKISLNVAKTEVILFKPKNKQLDTDLKLKLCRKQLYTTTQVRYLAILIANLILITLFQNL